MGTSRGYRAPTGGEWPSFKRLLNEFGENGGEAPEPVPPDPEDGEANPQLPPISENYALSPMTILGRYVSAHGTSGGRGGGGGGGSQVNRDGGRSRSAAFGRSATRVGGNLGSFANRVSEVGLTETLRELGLDDIVGRPADEVASAIVERLSGPGTTMDAAIAHAALDQLRQDLLAGATTYDDVEQRLGAAVEGQRVTGLVVQFFGHYIFLKFCRDSYERLVKRIGSDKTKGRIETIRQTISASLQAKIGQRDATRFDWGGAEGRRLADDILDETLHIFEAYA